MPRPLQPSGARTSYVPAAASRLSMRADLENDVEVPSTPDPNATWATGAGAAGGAASVPDTGVAHDGAASLDRRAADVDPDAAGPAPASEAVPDADPSPSTEAVPEARLAEPGSEGGGGAVLDDRPTDPTDAAAAGATATVMEVPADADMFLDDVGGSTAAAAAEPAPEAPETEDGSTVAAAVGRPRRIVRPVVSRPSAPSDLEDPGSAPS